MTKTCSKCDDEKDIDFFPPRTSPTSGRPATCKACKSKVVTQKRREAPDSRYFSQAKTQFGVTEEQYYSLLQEQGDCCAICKTEIPGGHGNRFHIDHDHETDEIRGLLCVRCNLALGYFGDNLENLRAAIVYLTKKHPGLFVVGTKAKKVA